MVAYAMFPCVTTCGSAAGSTDGSPLQPSHTPPVCDIAAINPVARPPGLDPLPGTEMRLETQTSRFNENGPFYSGPLSIARVSISNGPAHRAFGDRCAGFRYSPRAGGAPARGQ